MNENKRIVALAAVAVVLGVGVMVLAVINPYAALGLAPVLLAVAGIIRAIRGRA
jgi:hypothetical protein